MNSRLQPFAFLLCLPLLIATGAPVRAQTVETAQEAEYHNCMRLARTDPGAAFEHALSWQDLGGGVPARHCEAVALMMLGQPAEAAARFEELAKAMPDSTPPEIVADVMAHAGIAWMDAGDLDRARAAQTAALDIHPDSPAILVDRAMVLSQQSYFWEAIDDLNRSIDLDPTDPAAFALRASAYRFVDAEGLALEDANRALSIDPDQPEALLERGILLRLKGDLAGARRDWLHLIEMHDGRPAAELARRNLEKLDVKE